MANVFVFIPAYRGQISAVTFEASHRLMSGLMAKGIPASIASYSYFDIAELRNMVLSVWYDVQKQCTHLLFIDDDMGFSPNLVIDMLAFNEPVVGAIYPKRGVPRQWSGSGIEAAEYRQGFIEVEGVGGGCLLIRRDAVDKMVETYPELIGDYMTLGDMKAAGGTRTLRFFDQLQTPEGKRSEDFSFCQRWRDAGGVVWAATAHEIQHVGPWIFSACFAKERAEEMKARAEERQRLDEADEEAVRRLVDDEITLLQAQQLVVTLGPAASHKLRNAIAERMGCVTFENRVYPERPAESLNGQGAG
jgi:hypothetical protein